jgi:hypothetical protein
VRHGWRGASRTRTRSCCRSCRTAAVCGRPAPARAPADGHRRAAGADGPGHAVPGAAAPRAPWVRWSPPSRRRSIGALHAALRCRRGLRPRTGGRARGRAHRAPGQRDPATTQGLILGAWRDVGAEVNRYRQVRAGPALRAAAAVREARPAHGDAGDRARGVARATARARPQTRRRRRSAPVRAVGRAPRSTRDAPLEGADLEAAVAALPDLVAPGPDGEDDRRRRCGARSERAPGRVDAARRAALAARRRSWSAVCRTPTRAEEAEAEASAACAPRPTCCWPTRTPCPGAPSGWRCPASTATRSRWRSTRLGCGGQRRAPLRGGAEARGAGRAGARAARRGGPRPPRSPSAGAALDALDDEDLEASRNASTRRAPKRPARCPGLRVVGPHGFEVVIGRNARENDDVTFRVARSLDVWLHAQGVHGAHVVVRSGGREVPVETLRFAAELAAGHAEVADDNGRSTWRSSTTRCASTSGRSRACRPVPCTTPTSGRCGRPRRLSQVDDGSRPRLRRALVRVVTRAAGRFGARR